ncbi:hypothetical protein SEVIR_9G128200v4 [Setaria viridis]|uniref:C2H2-type domain-containing protein n=1 Tax=Setaria viridis TaxID=4556 RepID=A0A4U6SSR2_SETVI|nr:hypothetical protein SEVIR_9G128200v2 [Setaria viridis]
MVVVVEGEEYYSDSDSDDDVDRYVFLARPPAPAAGRRHAEDDRGASSANDDDDGDGDATGDEEEPERGGGRTKRRPLDREILDGAPPPPPPKRARLELIAPPFAQTPPSGSGSETESDSDSAALPCVDVAGESGSEGSHDHEKVHGRRAPGKGGEANNATKRKRGACGKRGRGPGCEADGDRAVTAAAKAGAPPAATSGRFLCNLCERCFDSFQALGGHVLGHRKKAKVAIAAAASLDVDDAGGVIGNCKEEAAVVEANEETANGIAQAGKMVAVAARRGKANGGGGCHDKIKTVDGVAEHRDDVGFGNKGNGIAVSSHCFTNGGNSRCNEKTGIGAAISNQKAVVGSCHEGANGDGNGVRRTLYKCKVCGTECPTGRALGGHMRKHRKRPPPGGDGGGGEGRSPSPATDGDFQIPLSRLFVPRENTIGLI